jgi:hypothetical protein
MCSVTNGTNLHTHLDGVAELLELPQLLLELCEDSDKRRETPSTTRPNINNSACTCDVLVSIPTSSSNQLIAVATAAEHACRCSSLVTALHSWLSSNFSRIMYL